MTMMARKFGYVRRMVIVPEIVLIVVMLILSTQIAGAQDVKAIATASKAVAENISHDVTVLALQAAVASILVNFALVFYTFRLVTKALTKPCMLTSSDQEAIMRDAVRRACRELKQGL